MATPPSCRCLPPRTHTHCFSEAAKLLIKAFAFYIWRTRTHTPPIYIYIVYTICICVFVYIVYATCVCVCVCAGVLATIAPQVMQQKCESSASHSTLTRFAYHAQRSAAQSRDFKNTPYTPSLGCPIPPSAPHLLIHENVSKN